jgi:hypothetical protein
VVIGVSSPRLVKSGLQNQVVPRTEVDPRSGIRTLPQIVFKGIAKASPIQKILFESECSRYFNSFQLLRKSPWSGYFLG